jgi:hypothetical protein
MRETVLAASTSVVQPARAGVGTAIANAAAISAVTVSRDLEFIFSSNLERIIENVTPILGHLKIAFRS